MPIIDIRGYKVRFPFEPYPAQIEYMGAVLQALDSGTNALLESPTGTGKTMCLLCATLAWAVANQRNVVRHPRFDAAAGLVHQDPADRPKIVYCSRTHAQLTQVIRELKRVLRTTMAVPACPPAAATQAPAGAEEEEDRGWSDVTVALLGSREHMCVNSEVSRLPSTHTQQSMCNALRADKGCRFFLGLQFNKAEGCLPTNDDGDAVYDMEDLVREGKRNGFCPYYLERDLAKSADIVFMPYNYILDSHLRKQLPFELNKKCILIVDEAHNLPSVLSASACLTLQPLELANAIQDCTRAISMQRLVREGEGKDPQRERLLEEEFMSLKILLARLEAGIAQEQPPPASATTAGGPSDTSGGAPLLATSAATKEVVRGEIVRPGAYMEAFLAKALITREVYEGTTGSSGMSTTMDNAVAILADSEKPASGIARVQRFLSAVFTSPIDESTRFIVKDAAGDGGNHTRSARPGSGTSATSDGAHTRPSPAAAAQERRRSLGFWRLDNSADLMELSSLLHSLLLTSGTLSPLDHFAAELGAPFPVRLCGSHVIGPDQVLGSVLCRGPTGDRLNGSYACRNSVEYRVALGITVLNVSRVTPGGTLVFFPSYAALHSAIDLWRAGTGKPGEAKTIWGLLSEQKPVFVEPAGSGDLAPVVAEFQKAVRVSPRKGAVLLAVCRGKVSEGIDFADNDGRCVMVTGIPYANHTDLFVRLKREYLTSVASGRPRVNGKLFTGDSWYRHEAMRAVNQCVGRVIRHKDDYGAVLLADERFADQGEMQCLSEWVATCTAVHRDFRECFPVLARFFAKHAQHRRDGARLGQSAGGTEEGCCAAAASASSPNGSGAQSAPPSATLAKEYALKQAREAAEEARERQRRRREEAEETPTTALPQPRPTGTAALDAPGTDAPRPHEGPTGCPPHPLRMQKQTIVLPPHCASGGTGAAAAGEAARDVSFPAGSSSKEFCAFLKKRVQPTTYERFKGVLKGIALMRGGGPQQFDTSVGVLTSIFAEAAPGSVADLLLEFGRHIPETLRPGYAGAVRRRP